jgi:hypothetical protein
MTVPESYAFPHWNLPAVTKQLKLLSMDLKRLLRAIRFVAWQLLSWFLRALELHRFLGSK